MYLFLLIVVLLVVGTIIYLNHPKFGQAPRGERLARIKQLPNYRNGRFYNQHVTPQITLEEGSSKAKVFLDFLFQKQVHLRPPNIIPVIHTNLKNLDINKNFLVWFGHSSYFFQINGKKFLVDPVFEGASPISFFNKPFKGTDIYKAEDMPEIDYLVITHGHWDHLDYKTVKKLKYKTQKVVCPFGLGAYFEYWGFDKNNIIELAWNENHSPEKNIIFYCLPARHFSGRRYMSNKTLWASFMLQIYGQNIYIGGDSGYDTHFADIAKQFPKIDVAILENGQYNKNWRYIHTIPENFINVLKDLNANKVFAVHHSKFALAKHAWYEPLNSMFELADTFHIAIPKIGEVVYLDKPLSKPLKWWDCIE